MLLKLFFITVKINHDGLTHSLNLLLNVPDICRLHKLCPTFLKRGNFIYHIKQIKHEYLIQITRSENCIQ